MVLTETPDYSDRILKYNCNFSGMQLQSTNTHLNQQGRREGGFRGVLEPPVKF